MKATIDLGDGLIITGDVNSRKPKPAGMIDVPMISGDRVRVTQDEAILCFRKIAAGAMQTAHERCEARAQLKRDLDEALPAIIDVDELDHYCEHFADQHLAGRLVRFLDEKLYPLVLDLEGSLCIAYIVSCDHAGRDGRRCGREPQAVFLHPGAGQGWGAAYTYWGGYEDKLGELRDDLYYCSIHGGTSTRT